MIRSLTRISSCLLVACLVLPAIGQTWRPAEVIELTSRLDASRAKFLAIPRYIVRSEVLVYRDAKDAAPTERGTSTVWNTPERVKAEHLGVTTLQDKELRVAIDPEEQVLVLSGPEDIRDLFNIEYRDEVFRGTASIERAEHAGGEQFRVKFAAGAELHMIIFRFDKDAWLRCMETWWAEPMLLEPDNPLSAMVKPRVVLNMGVPEVLGREVVLDAPRSVVSIGKEVRGIGPWKEYQVIDNRNNP